MIASLAWVFPVIDRYDRQVTARVTVNGADRIVISPPYGEPFSVDTEDQYAQFSAALRQARDVARERQERRKRPPRTRHRRERHDQAD